MSKVVDPQYRYSDEAEIAKKTLMMISDWKNHFGLHGLYNDISAL